MDQALSQFMLAMVAVTLAEMGDKTQLLAMCFAARYSAAKVLAGVFLATVVNHALAVVVGVLLRETLTDYSVMIQIIASLSFIGFALWTIHGDTVEDKEDSRFKAFGPVVVVTIAFFLAEMGDKTQLTTVSLAAKYTDPLAILAGTTAGMLIADAIGIIIGVVLNRKIPENAMKWFSAIIFAAFGLYGFAENASKVLAQNVLVALTVGIAVLTCLLAVWIRKSGVNRQAAACRIDPDRRS